MATSDRFSRSPEVHDVAPLHHHRESALFTPKHSPHHSGHSATSLRTPVHTLSIHEYRKQQNTPLSRIATPSGKTLRRKASTFTLNEVDRVPSITPTQQRDPHMSTRPLHPSYSAHQLAPPPSFLGCLPVSDQPFRSQSAEPRAQGDSISSVATIDSLRKERQFGTRKRLPRPSASTRSGLQAVSYEPLRPTRQIRASLPAPLSFLTEGSNLSDAQTTSTPSLSRFPQPPRFETLREAQREKAVSFVTTAPATPPATPATIHYRGASFDLVNPHASLPYHDIVTPSRDFDYSDFLTLESPRDSYNFSEMAPKRPLYGDFTAAHAGIVRRVDNISTASLSALPLPPVPAAISPVSSAYTSPIYSPESCLAPSPLAVQKAPAESRFSLKQLTRSLTQRLTKNPSLQREHEKEEELQQLRDSSISGFSIAADEEPLRPLEQTYMPTNRISYFPISPISPTSPTSPASSHDLGSVSGEEEEEDHDEFVPNGSNRDIDLETLASMVPDDQSTHIGRANHQRSSTFASERGSRAYYDDLASIYASSSIYTADGHRQSAHQQSILESRQSNAFMYDSEEYSYGHLGRNSRPLSRHLAQQLRQKSTTQDNEKTDTISKFIDQYETQNTTTNSLSTLGQDSADITDLIAPYASDTDDEALGVEGQQADSIPSLSRFEFGLRPTVQPEDAGKTPENAQPTVTRECAFNYRPGLPPIAAPPLAPAFQHQQETKPLSRPEVSETFSNESYTSYGDTRHLLQLQQSGMLGPDVATHRLRPSSSYSQPQNKALEPSSSYSQPEGRASPQTPQEALDYAELIFEEAAAQKEHSQSDIPAMWGRRSSLNLNRSKRLTDGSVRTSNNEKAEWETVAGDSQQGRISLDSIADYSSSEGSRNSLGLTAAASLPSWSEQNRTRGPSFYGHPSPIREHTHPFNSSPPRLGAAPTSVFEMARSDRLSSTTQSSTVPVFRFSSQPRRAVEEPYALAPWADPYALSDKETQELLASGPNDDILFGSDVDRLSRHLSENTEEVVGSSPSHSIDNGTGLERENTFENLTVLGPKGNLTGSPQGSGMHDAGSSIADTSSPGAKLSSSPHSDYDGFYSSPFPAVASVTRIRQAQSPVERRHERTVSQMTMFPSAYTLDPVQSSSPLAGPDRRPSLRNATTFKPARRASRAAVPGQTKLRQMVLAPDVRSTISSNHTHFSPFISTGGSDRPSTSDTSTPLRLSHPSLDIFPTFRSGKAYLPHQHSPHLLCPERDIKEEDDARRRKLSWLIFACFCILPPCLFLYRTWGDSIIMSVTNGDLGHCTSKSKRAALIAGVVVNVGLVTAILVPILVAQAMKAI